MCSGPVPAAPPVQLLATLLIQYERLQGVRSSGVLIIFWFLCVVCGIIPFRSKILSALTQVRGKEKPARSHRCLGIGPRAQGMVGSQAPPLCPSSAPRTSSAIQSLLCHLLLVASLLRSRLVSRVRVSVPREMQQDAPFVGCSCNVAAAVVAATVQCSVCAVRTCVHP